jgi:hypothetical protein
MLSQREKRIDVIDPFFGAEAVEIGFDYADVCLALGGFRRRDGELVKEVVQVALCRSSQ